MKITENWVTPEPVRLSLRDFRTGGLYRHENKNLSAAGVTYALGTTPGSAINLRTGHPVCTSGRVWIEVDAELIIKGDK